ncbi:MAG: Gfo/Idh/MocA family protein [Egibacteraceae bacterium]
MRLVASKIGVVAVGYGYWGPNVVRNLAEHPEFRLLTLCELDAARAAEFSRRYPECAVERRLEAALEDPRVEAVAIATPPSSHYEIAREALEAGKHVLVEKPLAATAPQAAELVALAEQRGLVLMPGHTFVYSPPVNKVRELIRTGELGDPHFVTSSRMNLGLYQPDGVIRDLAPHDISILLHWFDQPVVQVTASGCSVFNEGVLETAFITLELAGGVCANIQLSWLAPRRMRQTIVVGSRRMIQYDDTAGDEQVRVYDRGLEFGPIESFGEHQLSYRTGDMVAPRIQAAEPLALELEDFATAIRTGVEPQSSARLGLHVVQVLEACEESLRRGGYPVAVPLESHADLGSPDVLESLARAAAP